MAKDLEETMVWRPPDPGTKATWTRTITADDVEAFAHLAGAAVVADLAVEHALDGAGDGADGRERVVDFVAQYPNHLVCRASCLVGEHPTQIRQNDHRERAATLPKLRATELPAASKWS